MTLLDKAVQAAAKWIVKKNPIGALEIAGRQPRGGELLPRFNMASHLKVHLTNAYCFAAIKAISRDVASVPVLVKKRSIKKGKYTWTEDEKHEVYKLINSPNPHETRSQLTERLFMATIDTGNGYWHYTDRGDRPEIPGEFWHVQPDWVKPIVDSSGKLQRYHITNAGLTFRAETDMLIHWKLANPEGDFYGIPPSLVIKETIMTELNLQQYVKDFFGNFALAGSVFSTDQTLNPAQREATRVEIEKLLTGSGNRFKTAIMDRGQKLERLSHTLKDLVPKEMEQIIIDKVCAAYQVPPGKLMMFGDMTFANADKMDKIYGRDTVRPHGKLFAEVLTLQFIEPRYGDDIRLEWDEDSFPGLQRDFKSESETYGGLKDKEIITTNEAREKLGFDPHPDGDELKKPAPEPIQPADDPNADPMDVDSEDQDKEKQKAHTWAAQYATRHKLSSKEQTRVEVWKRHDLNVTKFERQLIRIIKEYFSDQEDRIIRRAKRRLTIAKSDRFNHAKIYAIIRKDKDDPRALEDIFDLDEENRIMINTIAPYIRMQMLKTGTQEGARLGLIGWSFNLDNPGVMVEIDMLEQRAILANDESWRVLRELLIQTESSGGGINEFVERVNDTYNGFGKYRAERIGRTESNAVVSAAKHHAGVQAGATHKEWFSQPDARGTRPGEYRHDLADGEIVAINDMFVKTGQPLRFPGDPQNGAAGNVINCRCAHVNVIPE